MAELIYKEECYRIIGACMEVYREKGCGFTEPVYQECLEMELDLQGIPFLPQHGIPLTYKRRALQKRFVADVFCDGKIIVELKAVSRVTDEHRAQLLNYLHATKCRLGLLVNFGHYPKLEWERIVI